MTVETAVWSLAEGLAHLSVPGWTAEVPLQDLALGLQNVTAAGQLVAGGGLFSILPPHDFPRGMQGPSEVYIRQRDLVATFETPLQPGRVQIYWRAQNAAAAGLPGGFVLDVQISVQTRSLDSHPQCELYSRVPFAGLSPIAGLPGEPTAAVPGESALGWWSAPPNAEQGLAIFVHPADCAGAVRVPAGPDATTATLKHVLFPGFLEKGVILRARLQLVGLPQANAAQLPALFAQFLAQPLPLTT